VLDLPAGQVVFKPVHKRLFLEGGWLCLKMAGLKRRPTAVTGVDGYREIFFQARAL